MALLPLMASCALGPPVVVPDTRLPAAYEAPVAANISPARLDRWWAAYNDGQLDALIEQALANAPDARSARARLDEALAVRSEALDRFNPQGGLTGSASTTQTSVVTGPPPLVIPGYGTLSLTNAGRADNQAASFDVSWEVDLFGRRRAAQGAADADLAAARFDAEATRASLAAAVADQLFQARDLAIQLADAREAERIQRALADIADRHASHGLGTAGDADQAAALVAESAARTADLESQLHAARRALLILIGRGVDPLESLPIAATASAPPDPPASVPGDLLARRPDVREAAENLLSASGQLKLNELALFPTFTLQPGVGLTAGAAFGSPLTSVAWSIGMGLAAPVLDRPRLKSEIHAQGARVDQAAIAYEKAVRTAYGEAENSLVALSADEASVAALTAGEVRARRAYDAAQSGYAAGVADLAATLDAERTWREARIALSDAQVQALRRSVQAFKALGGGWSPPAVAVAGG